MRDVLDDPPDRLVTSTYVFDETVTLTQARLGHRRAVVVGRTLLDPAIVEWLRVTPVDEMRRERIGGAIALAAHFAQEGFTVVPLEVPAHVLLTPRARGTGSIGRGGIALEVAAASRRRYRSGMSRRRRPGSAR